MGESSVAFLLQKTLIKYKITNFLNITALIAWYKYLI